MPEHYRAFWFCKTFQWTEQGYLDASAKFCDEVIWFWNKEHEVAEQQAEKQRGGD